MIRAWAYGCMFLSMMIRALSCDYVYEKRAAVCIPQPSKQGFFVPFVRLLFIAFLLVVIDRAVCTCQPDENFTDNFQYSQRVSPKWFHNDLLFNCSRQRWGKLRIEN